MTMIRERCFGSGASEGQTDAISGLPEKKLERIGRTVTCL